MHAGEFAQGQSDGQTDECGQDKTENHSRPGDFESCRRSQQQSGSDRPAHGDHSHLAGAELVLKASFFNVFRHLAPIPETFFSTKDIFADDFRNRHGTRLRCRCRNRPLKSYVGYYARYPCLSCQSRQSESTEPRSPDA